MMVKSINPLKHGQYKTKKVWIPIDDQENNELEMQVEIIDYSKYTIVSYNKKGKIVIKAKNISIVDMYV